MTQLVPGATVALEVDPDVLQEQARRLAENSRAANTRRAYQCDMDQFRIWCAAQYPPREALPAHPVTVALYLTALADIRKPATIRRRMDSISVIHQLMAGETSAASVRSWPGGLTTVPGLPGRARRPSLTGCSSPSSNAVTVTRSRR